MDRSEVQELAACGVEEGPDAEDGDASLKCRGLKIWRHIHMTYQDEREAICML
jgi:hypothetical protein